VNKGTCLIKIIQSYRGQTPPGSNILCPSDGRLVGNIHKYWQHSWYKNRALHFNSYSTCGFHFYDRCFMISYVPLLRRTCVGRLKNFACKNIGSRTLLHLISSSLNRFARGIEQGLSQFWIYSSISPKIFSLVLEVQ
jgi:hypothetical protein